MSLRLEKCKILTVYDWKSIRFEECQISDLNSVRLEECKIGKIERM